MESKNKKSYEIEIIVKKCDSIENKKEFINYVSQILEEKQNSFLYQIYAIMKKDFIIKTLEKTLKIMNEGGLVKNNINGYSEENKIDNNNIRSVGGTFIYLVKSSDLLSKDILKKIFWKNKKKKEMKRKLYKSFNKLNINTNFNIKKEKEKEKENK